MIQDSRATTVEKTKIKEFTDLLVWQKAHELVVAIYKTTRSFPREEASGLSSQMRRSAVSITSILLKVLVGRGIKKRFNFIVLPRVL